LHDELNQFAHDLLWTWEPRIEALFQALSAELWESTRQNPVLLLIQLGESGIEEALNRDEVKHALEGARAAYREYYDRRPPFMDARAPMVIAYFSLEFGLAECLPCLLYTSDAADDMQCVDLGGRRRARPDRRCRLAGIRRARTRVRNTR